MNLGSFWTSGDSYQKEENVKKGMKKRGEK